MAKAVKNTITITVYTDEPLLDDRDYGDVEGFPFLSEVIYGMTYGHAVGSYEIGEPQNVEGDELEKGLIDIGNDGAFFDQEDDDEEDDDGNI